MSAIAFMRRDLELLAYRIITRNRRNDPVCVDCNGSSFDPRYHRALRLCEPCGGTGLACELGGEA